MNFSFLRVPYLHEKAWQKCGLSKDWQKRLPIQYELKKIFNTSKSIIFRKGKKINGQTKEKQNFPHFPPFQGPSSPFSEHKTTRTVGHYALHPKGNFPNYKLCQTSNYLKIGQLKSFKSTSLINLRSGRPAPFCVYSFHELLYFLCLLQKDRTC